MNSANIQLHSLKEVMPRYRKLTGLETTLEDVVDLAMIVIKAVGNIALATYSYKTEVKDYHACLPCDVYHIVSVTGQNAFNNSTLVGTTIANKGTVTIDPVVGGIVVYDDYNNYVGTTDILNLDKQTLTLNYNHNVIGTPLGAFIPFARVSNRQLKFNIQNLAIELIYTALVQDEEGLPLVEDKTITAICRYIFYLKIHQGYFMKIYTKDQVDTAEKDYNLAVGRARIGEAFSSNEMDSILESNMTFKRKSYGLPFRT